MASVERSASGRRVCFRNLFKRSRSPDNTPSNPSKSRKVSSDSSGNSLPTDCSMSRRNSDMAEHHHRRKSRRQRFHDSVGHESDSDMDSLLGTPQRASSLFRCFGSRTSRHSNSSRKRHHHHQHSSGSQTATTASGSMRRSKTCDDDCVDTADSNVTTRSTAVDNHHHRRNYDDDDDYQSATVKRMRSRGASFYSVVSFCDDDDDGQALSRSRSINRSKMGRSSSRCGRDSQSTGILDDDDDFSDFFSLDGDDFDYDGINDSSHQKEVRFSNNDSVEGSTELTTTVSAAAAAPLCPCGFDGHVSVYSPEFPLITGPGIVPDSHEECLAIANACAGCWETIVERSETLDPQYRCIGLGMVKRAVMNRLAVPLTMFLEENDSIFHCWIHTPLGLRHMRSNLHHQESTDDDPDAGQWKGTTHVIDFSIPWFCEGKSVRAIQQIRHNVKVGTSIETRCILPDQAEGKIMLFQFVMIPKGKTEKDKLKADRLLKYMGPKEG